MSGILCSSMRITSKNALSIIRRIHNKRKKAVPLYINFDNENTSLSNFKLTIFNCRTNIHNNNKPSSFNANSRWFKTSIMLHEEQDIFVPEFIECIKEGIVKWRKKVTDDVVTDEVVCSIKTEKSDIELHSPGDGCIAEQYVGDGVAVKGGQKIFRLKLSGAKRSQKEQLTTVKTLRQPDNAGLPSGVVPSSQPQPKTLSKPPPEIKTTSKPQPEPKTPSRPPPVPKTTSKSPPAPKPGMEPLSHKPAIIKDLSQKFPSSRSEFKVKLTEVRKRTVERLIQTKSENALLTTFNEIDMTNVTAFRKEHQKAFTKKHGVKLGFMSTALKATAYALQDQPVVNACIIGDEIVYRDYIDISLTVATSKGLVVPVIRNVTSMNFADIEKSINSLAEKAAKGKLAVEDMDGGTFTISNGGVFGSIMQTSITNPPQSAVLGMHATVQRPVAVKGKVIIRPMMYVALTYDHRLIDGREAVTFLRKIKLCIENPVIMMSGL